MLATAIACGLAAHQPNHINFRILLVGVDNYAHLGKLWDNAHGVEDCDAFKTTLEKCYSLKEENFYPLYEEKATKTNITAAVDNWLVKDAEANDRLVFYFSGHGSLVNSGGQPMSAIVPYSPDLDSSGCAVPASLIDKTFFDSEIQTLKGQGVSNLTLIFDACDSGLFSGGNLSSKTAPTKVSPPGQVKGDTDITLGDTAIISAAHMDRLALDDPTNKCGLFTEALTSAFNEYNSSLKSDASPLTYNLLRRLTLGKLACLHQDTPQDPVFATVHPDQVVFGTSLAKEDPAFTMTMPNHVPTVDGGSVFGFKPGVQVSIYKKDATHLNAESVLATAEVLASDELHCQLKFPSGFNLSDDLSGCPARIVGTLSGKLVSVDVSRIEGMSSYSSIAQYIKNLPTVAPAGGGTPKLVFVPPGAAAGPDGLFPASPTKWTAYDAGSGWALPSYPSDTSEASTEAWATSCIADVDKASLVNSLANQAGSPWTIQLELVPVTTKKNAAGQDIMIDFAGPITTGGPDGVQTCTSDGKQMYAIRVSASPAGHAAYTDHDRAIQDAPNIVIMDVTAHGKVEEVWPRKRNGRLIGGDKPLVQDGNWYYLGLDGDFRLASEDKSKIWAVNFGPSGGVGEEVLKALATSSFVDFTPLLTTSRGPRQTHAGSPSLARIMEAVSRASLIPRDLDSKFAVAQVTVSIQSK